MPGGERVLPTILVAPGRRAAGRFGLAEVYAVIAALSFLVARFVPVLAIPYECPLRMLTGYPCATCGMTHAFVFLAHGRVADAFRWSPLGALLACGAWAFAALDLLRVVAGWPMPFLAPRTAARWLWIGVAAVLLNWGYLLVYGLGP